MIGWEEYKLGNLVEIGRGASPRPIKNYVTDKPGIPWVKIADATKSINKYIEKTNEYIVEEGRRKTVYPGELIVSNSATPGIPKLMKIEACVHDGWLVFDEYKNIETLYLYYFFLDYRRILAHSASGTVFKNLTTEIVKNVKINLPPLAEQKAIAKVLTAFDDKIELLQAQNNTLESMAQTIYKEWFGKYQIGDVLPEGWRVGKLAEEFDILMGQSPKGSSYNENGEGTIFFQGRTDFTSRFPAVRQYTSEPKRIADQLDVLVSVRAPVGDINVASHKCCIGRGLSAVKSNNKSYCLYKLLSLKPIFELFESEGTVFGSINKNSFSNIEVVIPDIELIIKFEEKASKIDLKIFNNSKQIQSLTKTRDTLLPKLMSGQVRVNNLKQRADA